MADWLMPEIDGISCCQMIKDSTDIANPRMVIITGYDQDDARDKVKSAGIDAYMLKPLRANDLSKVIEKIFQDRRVKPEFASASTSSFDFKNLNVLLVEDVKMNQELAIEILSKKDISVTVANNGKEGVDEVERNDFDIILMDMQMPVMDGCQATEEIRSLNRNLPIVAMTANAMTGDKNKCLASGMNDYITKPINPEEMFKAIAKWVSYSRNLGTNNALPEQASLPTKETQPEPEALKENIAEVGDTTTSNELKNIDSLPNNLAGIDLNEGLQRCQHNTKLYLKFLADFKRDYGESGLNFRTLAKDSNLQGIKELAHKVKGVTSNLAAKPLADVADKIESINGIAENEIAALLDQFDAELATCLASMTILLENDTIFDSSDLEEKITILSQLVESQKLEAQDLALEYFSAWPIEEHKVLLKSIIDALDIFDFAKADELIKVINKSI